MGNSPFRTPAYEAASSALAVAHRSDRRFLGVKGKAPKDMLLGILTSGLPVSPAESEGMGRGEVVYSAILDAKGRMISDLRVFGDGTGGFILDLPAPGADGASAHLGKFLPPRFAAVSDLSGELALVTAAGSGVVFFLSANVTGGRVSPAELEELVEGEEMVLGDSPIGDLRFTPNGDLNAPAFDLVVPVAKLGEVQDAFSAAGAVDLDAGTLEVLRIERGRPAYGVDMDSNTIPVEAGIHGRAIDYGKGCYTGQETIIRIRDRGHVNKELRGLLLENAPVPSKGDELFLSPKAKSVGWVTSACSSPAFGQTIALGYLRREVKPGHSVRVGSVTGPPADVRALGDDAWVEIPD
jgi:folate-binding protein YgfZ